MEYRRQRQMCIRDSTSTDQAGNFRIGDDLQINQETGTISGRSFSKSLFNEMTPFILALS